MAEKTLIARIRDDGENPGLQIVASPVVGVADGISRAGFFLNPVDRILTVRVLAQRYTLRLPRTAHGRVVEAFLPDAATPVAFDQPLLRLDPRAIETGGAGSGVTDVAGSGSSAEEAEGTITVVSPSEGIFYRRPSPDADPFVAPGTKVRFGTVLGLVEVMKCFNQIAYGGTALPENGEIVEILADDTAEVQFGQPLFRVRPVG